MGRAGQVGGASEARLCAPGAALAPADLSLCSEEDGSVLKEKLAGPARFSPDNAAGPGGCQEQQCTTSVDFQANRSRGFCM